MWYLSDPTLSGWCKTDAHSTDFGLTSNRLERLPAGSISIWEVLTTHFLAQFFLPGQTVKLRNYILMFQQHQGESFSETWTRFKDLLQKVPHHGIDLWLQDNKSWNDPKDFAKPVKAISLPQDVLSTFDHRLIELKNQVQRLMEAHLSPKQPFQVNKISSSCEICSGPHDTQYCMVNPEQAFVDYASSRTDEAGDARLSKFEADFKQQQSEMTNKIDTVLKAITDRITGALPSDTEMDDPDITMEEYIQLMADKAQSRDFETNFPAIVYNDTSNQNVSSKPTVSIYNAIKGNIDFNISFSDSDDEDYTFIYNKNSLSHKLIHVDDLKPESLNDYVEINNESCSDNIIIKPLDMLSVLWPPKGVCPWVNENHFNFSVLVHCPRHEQALGDTTSKLSHIHSSWISAAKSLQHLQIGATGHNRFTSLHRHPYGSGGIIILHIASSLSLSELKKFFNGLYTLTVSITSHPRCLRRDEEVKPQMSGRNGFNL
ncbi:MAK10-like protein [Tanacetum coccineum]